MQDIKLWITVGYFSGVWYIRNHCPKSSCTLKLIWEFIQTRFYRHRSTSHLLLCNTTQKSPYCYFDYQSLPKHFSSYNTDFSSENCNYSLIGFARVSVLSLCWKLCLHWQINISGTGGEKIHYSNLLDNTLIEKEVIWVLFLIQCFLNYTVPQSLKLASSRGR